MSIIQLVRTFWIPSAEHYVRYLGVQCLNDDNLKHVFAFEGINAEGETWYAYFANRSRFLVKAINLGPQTEDKSKKKTTNFDVDAFFPKFLGFTDEEMTLLECFDGSLEVVETIVEDHIIPLGDFGFFMN